MLSFFTGCGEKDGKVTIVYSGDANEIKRSYIYKFGRQFVSTGSDVRAVSLSIEERSVLVKSRSIHHSNEAMNLKQWQKHTVPLTRVIDFIVESQSLTHSVIVIYDEDILNDIDSNNGQSSFQKHGQINMYYIYIKRDMRLSAMISEEANRTEIFVKAWDILGSVGASLIKTCHGNDLFSNNLILRMLVN